MCHHHTANTNYATIFCGLTLKCVTWQSKKRTPAWKPLAAIAVDTLTFLKNIYRLTFFSFQADTQKQTFRWTRLRLLTFICRHFIECLFFCTRAYRIPLTCFLILLFQSHGRHTADRQNKITVDLHLVNSAFSHTKADTQRSADTHKCACLV